MGRPIQPSYRRQFATFLGLLDPRCDDERHNLIEQGQQCPRCGCDIGTYLQAVPTEWPNT